MPDETLFKTALHDSHVSAGAAMGQDGGWEMPLHFGGALDEVQQARRHAAVFDISHVGRLRVRGDEALDLMERVCTADVVRQEDNTARYTLLCNDRGGIIDECLAVRLEDHWLLTTSPDCRVKVAEHLEEAADDFDVKVDDQTLKTTCICIAGPATEAILDELLPIRVAGMAPGEASSGTLMLARYVAMRTNYLGQWALEVIIPNLFAGKAWRFITEKAGEKALPPAGALARDVLRMEAGHCRYGHELNETIDPFTAGLGEAVDFSHPFVGREALEKIKEQTPSRRRVGLSLSPPEDASASEQIPGQGTTVRTAEGREVGTITSGTYSPALDRAVAMAYVASDCAQAGSGLVVDSEPPMEASVVDLPFC